MATKAHLPEEVPLAVAMPSGDSDVGNFKEIWNPATALQSAQGTGMYEAGGNLTWLDPVLGSAPEVARSEPAWSLVHQYSIQYFSIASAVPGASRRGRLIFPLSPMEAYVKEIGDLFAGGSVNKGKSMPERLVLVTGHAMLYAWWVAMARAVLAADTGHVIRLWECALTCTIRASVQANPAELNILSIQASEQFSTFEGMCDTFLLWARKIDIIAKDNKLTGSAQKLAEEFSKRGVRYNGSTANKGMILAAQSLLSLDSCGVSQVLMDLEVEYGRDLLSTSYNKLSRLASLTLKSATTTDSAPALFESVLGLMLLTLRTKAAASSFFTMAVLDKAKDGSAGWVAMTTAKVAAVKHLLHIAACLPDAADEVKSRLAAVFESPGKFMSEFRICASTDEVKDGEEGETEQSAKLLGVMCQNWSKPTTSVADMLHALHTGEFDSEMKALGAVKSAAETLVSEGLVETCPDLAARVREIMRQASTATSLVQCEEGAPGLTVRELARCASDPAAESAMLVERTAVWNRARSQRQKLVQLVECKNWTKAGLESAVAKATSVATFKGKLNEAHRLWVVSADLCGESDKAPWKEAVFRDKMFENTLNFLRDKVGTFDFVVGFDGRHRAARRMLEDKLAPAGQLLEELWIVYAKEKDNISGRTRRICLSAQTKEIGYMKIPGNRSKVITKERDKFVGLGEKSTHNAIFADVPLPRIVAMPKIALADKQKLSLFLSMDTANAAPEGWDHSGVPLFWRETKSTEFWRCFLDCFDIKAIVDLSPGSGALASAAMAEGCQYVGIAPDSTHLKFLQNTCDRNSLQYIVQNGAHLHQQDLAELIERHYRDVLDALQAQGDDHEDDEADAGDDPDDAVEDDHDLDM